MWTAHVRFLARAVFICINIKTPFQYFTVQSLMKSPAYRRFVKSRDEALESILQGSFIKIDNVLRATFTHWIDVCLLAASRTSNDALKDQIIIKSLATNLSIITQSSARQIDLITKDLRKSTYVLTVSSEAEAIGKALGRRTKYQIQPHTLHDLKNSETWSGGTFERRSLMALMKIQNNLERVVHWLMLNPDVGHVQARQMLLAKLPKTKALGSKKKVLKAPSNFTEADLKDNQDMSSGYVSDEDWNDMVDDYLQKNIKVNRGPEEYLPTGASADDPPHYAWEIEQETTQDFVYQVRQGQMDAAKQNGITDFIWVAIVDDKTDECCLWRDGLTTAEIEKKVGSDPDCDAIVPPAHFNCRCSLAPATDDIPEVPESNEQDFQDWLNS